MMKMVLCDKSEIAAIHYVKRGEIYFLFPMKGSLFDTTNTHTGLKKRLSERNRGRASCHCVSRNTKNVFALLCIIVPCMSICGHHLCVFSEVSVWLKHFILHKLKSTYDITFMTIKHVSPKSCQEHNCFF